MTNPTTQEGEDFETIVGLANPTKVQPKPQPEPAEHEVTPVKGTYPFDAPRPDTNNSAPAPKPNAHGHSSHRVGGTYPFDTPNPTAQAKDTTPTGDKTGSDKEDEGTYPFDNETD